MRRVFAPSALVAAGFAVLMALPAAAQTPAADPEAAPAEKNPVVATVNGKDIRLADVFRVKQQLPDPYRGYPIHLMFDQLVDMVIDRNLVAAEARSRGLAESKDVRETMARVEEQVLERTLMEQYIREKVTDDALHAEYDKMVETAEGGEQIRARHILVETEAEAQQVIEELAGGADFAQLAADRSTGPSKTKGGDLGYFGEGEMVAEFSEAAFTLQPGESTKEPVQTQFGWHVIKVEDRRKAEPPSFEESKDQLTAEVSREIGAAFVKDLRGNAEITRFNIDGSAKSAEGANEPEKK